MARPTINTVGSTTIAHCERQDLDFYQTPKYATQKLIERFDFKSNNVWEPMAGNGMISNVLATNRLNVYSSDVTQRQFQLDACFDYFNQGAANVPFDDFSIVTNPPYEFANQFLQHTLEVIKPKTCSVFLPVRYLEGKKRYDMIYKKYKPSDVFMFVRRIGCFTQRDIDAGIVSDRGVGSAVAYMWLCFDRTTWANPDTQTVLSWIE